MAASQEPCAGPHRLLDLVGPSAPWASLHQRADICGLVHRIAHDQAIALPATNRRSNSSAIDSATMKRLAAMHDCPLLMVRALTAVVDRGLEVGAGHHDEGVAAAQLEHRLLDLLPGRAGHMAACPDTAGQGHCRNPGILDDPLHPLGLDQQGLEAALGKAGTPEDVLDGQRALGHVGRVLEQADVTGPGLAPRTETPARTGNSTA